MSDSTNGEMPAWLFLLVYAPLDGGPLLEFPCDEQGRVVLDDLTDRSRDSYLVARALVGRDYRAPEVIRRLS